MKRVLSVAAVATTLLAIPLSVPAQAGTETISTGYGYAKVEAQAYRDNASSRKTRIDMKASVSPKGQTTCVYVEYRVEVPHAPDPDGLLARSCGRSTGDFERSIVVTSPSGSRVTAVEFKFCKEQAGVDPCTKRRITYFPLYR